MAWVSGYGEGVATYAERSWSRSVPTTTRGRTWDLDMQRMPAANVALVSWCIWSWRSPKGHRAGGRASAGMPCPPGSPAGPLHWDEAASPSSCTVYLGCLWQVPSTSWRTSLAPAREEAKPGPEVPSPQDFHSSTQPWCHGPGPVRGPCPLLGRARQLPCGLEIGAGTSDLRIESPGTVHSRLINTRMDTTQVRRHY